MIKITITANRAMPRRRMSNITNGMAMVMVGLRLGYADCSTVSRFFGGGAV